MIWLLALACRDAPEETAQTWERPANLGCLAPPRPVDELATIALEPQGVPYNQAVGAIWHEGDWLVLEKAGLVRDGQGALWADLQQRVTAGGERGLLGLALRDGQVYTSFTAEIEGQLTTRLERFPVGSPSERELLFTVDQPATNHNGGRLAFDKQGRLVLALGDGGGPGSPVHALDPADPLGDMLRFSPDFSAYEPIAWGLRNPWGWSFDRETGEIWVADVGWHSWEEVNLVAEGANLGWPAFEGFECLKEELCSAAMSPPLAVYSHEEGLSITGGFVYRGSDLPELVGSYVYGDYATGRIWALDRDPATGEVRTRLLLETDLWISSFAEDGQGELYVVQYGGAGQLHRITQAGEPAEDEFPALLSQTGCLDPAGLVPYEVRAPLWSDGALKDRWLALPEGSSLELQGDHLALPVGGVAIKHFLVDGERVETRLLARDQLGYAAYSYLWEGDDAVWSSASRVSGEHLLPSQGECMVCHSEGAGRTLGLELAQLLDLDRLQGIGFVPEGLPDFVPLDDSGRSVLHANCSGCHFEGEDLDLRFGVEVDWCAPPQRGEQPTMRAAVLERMSTRGAGQMPPLGTRVVDEQAVAQLQAELPLCP